MNKVGCEFRMTPEGAEIAKALKILAGKSVCIGYQADDAVGEDENMKEAPITNIAYWNNFGTFAPDGSINIPARPFMSGAFDNHHEEMVSTIGALLTRLAVGQADASETLNGVGVLGKALIQKEIMDGNFAPNSEFTINGGWARNKYSGKAFYAKGKYPITKPLVTGNADLLKVNYIIREEK